MTGQAIEQIISRARHLLLDFDGPVCSVFAGTAASQVAEKLRHTVKTAGFALPREAEQESDPLEVFRAVAALGPQAAATAQQLLTTFESRAVETARPTPGSVDLIITAYRTGRTVTIVSNNSTAAIMKYLADHLLSDYIRAVFGRDDDPALMKPSPYRVREAVSSLGADPHECAFVGDSDSDVLAGRLACVPVIGYANKPVKADALMEETLNHCRQPKEHVRGCWVLDLLLGKQ